VFWVNFDELAPPGVVFRSRGVFVWLNQWIWGSWKCLILGVLEVEFGNGSFKKSALNSWSLDFWSRTVWVNICKSALWVVFLKSKWFLACATCTFLLQCFDKRFEYFCDIGLLNDNLICVFLVLIWRVFLVFFKFISCLWCEVLIFENLKVYGSVLAARNFYVCLKFLRF
jgi:hypothetical protein